jgi:8-oxo-dGTP pyrophosphatase MutT (NUDIX family)
LITSRDKLVAALKQYSSPYREEIEFQNRFLELLKHPHAFLRTHLPGHITGSAWILDPGHQYTLLTHHAKLGKWLQPGGHADGDENISGVALREAREETGLFSLKFNTDSVFDIDIHVIPARKEMPEHFHYDIRFLLEASLQEQFVITAESHALGWKNLSDLPSLTGNNLSILRMAEKVKSLRADQQ